MILVVSPLLYDPPGVAQPQESVFVETFVAEPSTKAFRVGVLDRLPGVDEPQVDATLVCPLIQHLTRQVRPIVKDDRS